ncbi:hypothetical protein E1265_02080 [Streptomyces sp. 8K308]|uniref:hypothetical protein n=1 Tax=Streptomyces sp. 8K308 TaxID=2530388 RepID=UPI0010448D6C|nr:hypothetical protein [Streptomyces sp. 8K308]TDC27302.1 hypothetical protein E1265_02080 [Streptomyces sp. 8K308]
MTKPTRIGAKPAPTRWPLAAVAAGFAALSLLLVPPSLALGWDEIVYVSQWPSFGPTAPFSAPRSRGVPLLVAPVAAVTDSVVALRCWLAAAAGLALYLGYLPWLALLPGRRALVPVAAAAYGTLWFALFYGGSAMPNHYVAMAAVGAVGAFARRRWLALAAAVTAAGLMRASDAFWLALPLLFWPAAAGLAVRVATASGGARSPVNPRDRCATAPADRQTGMARLAARVATAAGRPRVAGLAARLRGRRAAASAAGEAGSRRRPHGAWQATTNARADAGSVRATTAPDGADDATVPAPPDGARSAAVPPTPNGPRDAEAPAAPDGTSSPRRSHATTAPDDTADAGATTTPHGATSAAPHGARWSRRVWAAVSARAASALAVVARPDTASARAVVVGLVAGVGPWVVEAEARFGGVWERLREASEIQGGAGLTFSLPAHAAALDGPLLCRPCEGDPVVWPLLAWWLALPPLTAVGLYVGRRLPAANALWLAVVTAGSLSFTYLFLIDYAATRFLLPVYALLAIPAMLGARDLARRLPWRAGAVNAVVAVVVLAHLAPQLAALRAHAGIQRQARADFARVAAVLRGHGVGPPCALGGGQAIPVAHALGCRTAGRDETPTALVLRDEEPPREAREWTVADVPDTYNAGWRVAVPPAAGAG